MKITLKLKQFQMFWYHPIFSPWIICPVGNFWNEAFRSDLYSSFHSVLFAGFPLELKFQTTAGFAKNTLVKTFGFHLNILYAQLSLGTGIFRKTSNIGGSGNSVGDAPALPFFTIRLVWRSCSCMSPEAFQSGRRSLASSRYQTR